MSTTKARKRPAPKAARDSKQQILPLAVYTVAEAAKLLSLSQRTIYRLKADRKLKAVKGPGCRFTGQELLRYLGVKN